MNRFVTVLRLAATMGLLTAVGELAMRAVQKLVLHRYIYLSRDIVWLTPLADLFLFGTIAVVLVLLSLALPRAASFGVALRVFVMLGVMSILTMQPWMTWWAMLIVAAGVAAMVGRLAQSYVQLVLRVVRVALPVLAIGFLLLGAGQRFRISSAERRLDARLPAAPAGSPNVLVIVWDAVRAQNLGLYGYARATTPRLAEFAKSGATFDQAIATAPYTLPTHASLFTGLWAHQYSASWETPLDASMPTLAEVLARQGYRTGAFSANHILVTWEYGLLRGFARQEDYVVNIGEVARSSALLKWLLSIDALRAHLGWYDVPGRRDAVDIHSSFARWFARDTTRPFFAFLNVFDAHDPYLPPAPFDSLFEPAGLGPAGRTHARAMAIAPKGEMSAAEHARQLDLYDGAIAFMDHNLGRLLDSLEKRGTLRNTLVVLLGDHGESFGEHGTYTHGNDVYTEVMRVPLVMVLPGKVPAAVRVPGVVSVRDVPATILEVLGLSPHDASLPGRSLSRMWAAPAASDTVLGEIEHIPRGGKPWYPVRRGDVRSIVAWPYHLITVGSSSIELYDLAADPAQRKNLAAQAEYGVVRDSLAADLKRRRADAVPTKR